MHQLRVNDKVADAQLAAAPEWWTKPGNILKRTSWTTRDAVAVMAAGPAVEKRGIERVHAEWFPGRRKTAPAVCSKCRAFSILSKVARGHNS